jgi:hypothetical protein
LEGLGQFGFRKVTLSPLEVLLVAFVSLSDFILHIAYAKDACALSSILPSLSLIDMIYFTADMKATPTSVRGVGVDI